MFSMFIDEIAFLQRNKQTLIIKRFLHLQTNFWMAVVELEGFLTYQCDVGLTLMMSNDNITEFHQLLIISY